MYTQWSKLLSPGIVPSANRFRALLIRLIFITQLYIANCPETLVQRQRASNVVFRVLMIKVKKKKISV